MNHEARQIGEEDHNREWANAEIGELITQLDAEAKRVGIQLAETDFVKIGPDAAMMLRGKLEMIISALAAVLGVSIAYGASHPLMKTGPEQMDAVRLAARLGSAAVAGGGAALMFQALKRLEIGYKRLQGYLSVHELKKQSKG